MFNDDVKWIPRPQDVVGMSTEQLRDSFLIADIFGAGELRGVFTALDRLVVGGAMPLAPLELPNHPKTGRAFFLERRELGAINVGGPGAVQVDGKSFSLPRLGCVYVPMGTRSLVFESANAKEPAQFYFLSCPAHAAYPAATMKKEEATAATLGSQANANRRTIHKYIHAGGIASCQLVMHTHDRRAEIYFYFDLGESALVHLMGPPTQTRHIFMHNQEVALSPPWSIHCGCGTGNYRFIWGMAGENQTFDDMDGVGPADLR
jgi:4-deoxy-L-threo-5-hexosulose-uronate ketol-isomerase